MSKAMNIQFNAEQLMDKLREIDVKLWEQVLDTIAWEGYERVGTWDYSEDGSMILMGEEE
jgi:hypothetical protein